MSVQTWVETLVSAQVDGSALSNTTTATSILPTSAVYTIPANYFYIGRVLRIRALGRISNAASAALTLDFRLGTLATPIIVFNGASVALNATSKTNVTWWLDATLTCRAVGSGTSANIMGIAQLTSEAVVGAAAGTTVTANLPASAPAVGTGFDSTISNVANLFATWGAASASNSIQLHEYTLESMN